MMHAIITPCQPVQVGEPVIYEGRYYIVYGLLPERMLDIRSTQHSARVCIDDVHRLHRFTDVDDFIALLHKHTINPK